MAALRRRAVRLISAAALLVPIAYAFSAPPNVVNDTAMCPPGMVPNPAGYGCVPDLAPGGAFVGAPSQELLTVCHGNIYICVWPYGRP
jgi:hypothetical protein